MSRSFGVNILLPLDGYNSDEIYAEDELFHVSVYAEARKIRLINKAIYYHVYVANSLSQGFRKNLFDMLYKLRKEVSKKLKEYKYNELAVEYEAASGAIVGAAILNACKTNYIQAKKNVSELFDKPEFIEMLELDKKNIHISRYRLLFGVAESKNPLLITLAVKGILVSEPIYRVISRI